MPNNTLSPHETLYLHEILSFKTTCAEKSVSMKTMTQDQELLGLINQDISTTSRQMKELQGILNSTGTSR